MQEDIFKDALKSLRSKHNGKELLNVQEVAEAIGVSEKTVRMGVKHGRGVPKYRAVGYGTARQHIRFPISEVARFIADTQMVY